MTEQDVINEEMYEEEDDDLPLQYRRLTQHLQTGSVDFNRRLAAYLTNQVAMRSAMDQMISNSYAQQYPNAPQFAHSHNRSAYTPSMSNGHMNSSPTIGSRQSPYPSPHASGFRPPHSRSYSSASPHSMMSMSSSSTNPSLLSGPDRRMSTPADFVTPGHAQPLQIEEIKADPSYLRQTQSAIPQQSDSFPLWPDYSSFSTALPPESQQMLGPSLDPADPMTSVLMAGSEGLTSNPYFNWGNMQPSGKFDMSGSNAMFNGAVAPSALENHAQTTTMNLKANSIGTPSLGRENSGASTQTNGDRMFAEFVQDETWPDDSAAA